MKRTGLTIAALFPVALLSGCAGMSNTDRGVLAGAGIGTIAGTAIGCATGNPAAGAIIGAGVGGVAGGVGGAAVDCAEAKADARLAAATAVPPPARLGLMDVVTMVQQSVSDDVIINQIRVSGSLFYLSPTDLNYLKDCGVSDRVVMEMQATPSRCYGRRVYGPVPVYGPPPVYVVEPPPVGVGVGFSYSRCR